MTDERARLHAINGGRDELPPFLERDPKTGRTKFIPKRLADQLSAETPIAAGGEALFVYRGGVYRANGTEDVRLRVTQALADDWTRARADEVVRFLRDSSPRLWESPPVDKINVLNGMLYLEGEPFLDPHDPEILSPVQIAAEYDPDATCPEIDAFIARALPDGEHLIHELAGYLATPDNRYQRAVMCLGSGGGGKSTMLNLLSAFIGTNNVSNVELAKLDEDRFATSDLYGKLANIFADISSSALRSSSIFKAITGGDYIRAERKGSPAFSFRPYARLLFSANEAPPTSDASEAFFDRWIVLPFRQRFRHSKEQDQDLIKKLTTPQELSGLLNHAIRGLTRLHEHRTFTTTADMDSAVEQFKTDADSVAGFFADQCELHTDGKIQKAYLYETYSTWCTKGGRSPLSTNRFTGRLRRLDALHGKIDEGKAVGDRYWTGFKLREDT